MQAFRDIYGESPSSKHLDAVATFERSLITPKARFDRYLRGDKAAFHGRGIAWLSAVQELRMHRLPSGDQRRWQHVSVFGVMGDYFKKRGNITPADLGRFNQTKVEADRHVFRVAQCGRHAALLP